MNKRKCRILGLTVERVSPLPGQTSARVTGLYGALAHRFDVVGITRPALPSFDRYMNKLRNFHPEREAWVARSGLNPWVFKRRTEIAEQQLAKWHGRYDLIVQLHTLVSPGVNLRQRAYVLHTDNTYALSERYYAPWAPLRGRERAERLHLERTTFQNAAFLFPRSEWLRRSMIEDYGCDPARVIRVGGGANFVAESIDEKRYDGQIALFVGGSFRRKGGFDLLRAWRIVQRRLPDAQLWIVGPERERKFAEAHPGVRWFGHISDRAALAELFAKASLFVLPSLFEPWGHVFLEAMGQGLPCIGTDHCAMPEIIQHGETGLLVPPSEPEPLAEALAALLLDPQQAERMGRLAYAQMQHGYTWDDVVDRMAPYIERAVDLSGHGLEVAGFARMGA